jgi:hypothetical protein
MKLNSAVAAALLAGGAFATDKLTADKVEADIKTDK